MAKTDSAKMKSTAEERLIALAALLNYGRIININEDDIKELYAKIEKINQLETDEDMQLACDYELDKINSIDDLRQRIKEQKSKWGTLLFEKYDEDKMKTAVYDVLRATSYNNSKEPQGQTNLNEKTAEVFAEIIKQKKLDDIFVPLKGKADNEQTYADKLAEIIATNTIALTARMKCDFESYKKRTKNTSVEEIIPDINHFLNHPITRIINFETGKSTENNARRIAIRERFGNKSRPDFVRLLATMQEIGSEYCDNPYKPKNKTNINQSFGQIEKIVGLIYGKDKEKVLQKMFGDNYAENKEQAIEKCVDLYGKLYTACLSEKINKEWCANGNGNEGIPKGGANNFTRNISMFINNAVETGKLNPFKIFECPIDDTKGDETNLTASVHHNFTIAAIENACGGLMDDTSTEACSNVVNNLGLFTLVIGKEVHGSLEPDKKVILGAETNGSLPNNIVFAGSAKGINAEVLERLGIKKESDLYKLIMRNVAEKDKNGRIFAQMKLPEGKFVENIRNECKALDEQRNAASRTIGGLLKATMKKLRNK